MDNTIKPITPRQVEKMRRSVGMQAALRFLEQSIEIGRDDALSTIGSAGEIEERAMVIELWSPACRQNRDNLSFDWRDTKFVYQLCKNSIERDRVVPPCRRAGHATLPLCFDQPGRFGVGLYAEPTSYLDG